MPDNDTTGLRTDVPPGSNALLLNGTWNKIKPSEDTIVYPALNVESAFSDTSPNSIRNKRSLDEKFISERSNRPRLEDKFVDTEEHLKLEAAVKIEEHEVSFMLMEDADVPPNPLLNNAVWKRLKNDQNHLHAINGHSSSLG